MKKNKMLKSLQFNHPKLDKYNQLNHSNLYNLKYKNKDHF